MPLVDSLCKFTPAGKLPGWRRVFPRATSFTPISSSPPWLSVHTGQSNVHLIANNSHPIMERCLASAAKFMSRDVCIKCVSAVCTHVIIINTLTILFNKCVGGHAPNSGC